MQAVLCKHTDIALMLLETPHVDVNMQDNVCGGGVCMCVCMCVCAHVCVCLSVHVRTCEYECVCACECLLLCY